MRKINSQGINSIVFRNPKIQDGQYLWELAKASKTLDVNSPYHYLIMCRHFGKTCLTAEKQGRVIGFVTAYIPPDSVDTVFVWQVAVDEKERGQGLGLHLLINIFKNAKAFSVRNLDATITPSNQASLCLFKAAARVLDAPFEFEKEFFRAADFGHNFHAPEMLFHIGPVL
ncbi:MAG: diaminobutyrate acetyltransferase [Desulfosalsimonadaceae bacterium]